MTFLTQKNVKNVRFLTSILGYQELEIDKSDNSISKFDYWRARNSWKTWKIPIFDTLKLRLKIGRFWRFLSRQKGPIFNLTFGASKIRNSQNWKFHIKI